MLSIDGVGAKTLRALALTSELIYGARASQSDPARFSFAHGGKDGTPYPVDRQTYDKTIEVMHRALNGAKIDRNENCTLFADSPRGRKRVQNDDDNKPGAIRALDGEYPQPADFT